MSAILSSEWLFSTVIDAPSVHMIHKFVCRHCRKRRHGTKG